jgi:hypothetical protein
MYPRHPHTYYSSTSRRPFLDSPAFKTNMGPSEPLEWPPLILPLSTRPLSRSPSAPGSSPDGSLPDVSSCLPVLGQIPSLAIFVSYRSTTRNYASQNGAPSLVCTLITRAAIHSYTLAGDIVYFHVFGRSMVVLNSLRAAQDLMEKRSLNYSCRPRFVLIVEM